MRDVQERNERLARRKKRRRAAAVQDLAESLVHIDLHLRNRFIFNNNEGRRTNGTQFR